MNHGWEKKKFDDCITKVKYPPKLQTKDYEDKGIYPIVSQESGLINGYTNNASVIFKHKNPVVIFGDHTRCVKYVDFNFALGADGIKILSPIDGILPKFFAYTIRSLQIPSLGYARHYRLLRDNNVPIPSKEEQQAIVAELDAINEAMEVKRKQLKALNALAQAIFYDTFGDPIANPKGWPMKRLSEVGSIITGSTPSTHNELYYDSADIPFVKPSDILQDSVSYLDRTEAWISRFAYNTAARKLPQNTILVTCIGIIGKVAISRTECSCNQQINAIIPLNSVNPEYMARCIHAKRSVLSEIANGPIVSIINKSSFSKFPVPIPPFPLQQQFAAKVKEIECEKENVEATIARLQTLLDSRMDYWFND